MLHIITPLYRFENLELIYNSILMNDDITWHISKSNEREDISLDFINKDKRIKIYNTNYKDIQVGKKRDFALKNIKNGYFCFLDDDTLFHENMYLKYIECKEENFIGMLVGEQIENDKIRIIASKPIINYIDVGNVISHSSCLSRCKWPEIPHVANDYVFWNSVYEFYGKKCAIWNQPISYYNKLNPKQIYGTKKEKHLK
jgi:hypothetical protein